MRPSKTHLQNTSIGTNATYVAADMCTCDRTSRLKCLIQGKTMCSPRVLVQFRIWTASSSRCQCAVLFERSPTQRSKAETNNTSGILCFCSFSGCRAVHVALLIILCSATRDRCTSSNQRSMFTGTSHTDGFFCAPVFVG